jgi:hypothetical protein
VLAHHVLFMSEALSQDCKVFEAFVDGFVARQHTTAHPFCFWIFTWKIRFYTEWIFSAIPFVGLYALSRSQVMLELKSKYLEIWPLTRRKWSADPDDITCADAQSNFISQRRTIELMRAPALCVGLWLNYPKVGAVDRNEAIIEDVVVESIFP